VNEALAVSKMSQTRRWLWVLALTWSFVVGGSLTWGLKHTEGHAFAEAKARTMAVYYKDLEYRRWNAGHGGVYVPVTEKTQPNPYLSHIPERDITTTTGKKFTLMNPAYMTRQVHELMQERPGGMRGHITSLNPIRPDNAADPWETAALKRFEAGESEVFSVELMEDGKQYFRYMHSMVVEKPCLKCHELQGYKLGDIRGGISVSTPINALLQGAHNESHAIINEHGVMWILGLLGLYIGGRVQRKTDEKARDREVSFYNIFEHANDALYLVDPETARIMNSNNKAAEMTGYTVAELTKMTVMELHPEDERARLPDIFSDIAEKGSVDGISGIHHLRKDGSQVSIEVNASMLKLGEKTVNLSVVRNVTERTQDVNRLKKHMEELERFQTATIDREFRIKALRDEIAALKKEKSDG